MQPRTIINYWTATSVAAVLGVIVPLAVATGSGGVPAALATAVIAFSATRFAWLVGTGEPRLMELSLWTFAYVFLGVAPLIQFQTGSFPDTAPFHYTSGDSTAMWAVLVSLVAALVGATLIKSGTAYAKPLPDRNVKELQVTQLAVVSLLCIGYYLYRVGLGAVWTSREELVAVQSLNWPGDGLGVMTVSALTLPSLVSFIGLIKVNQQRAGRGEDCRYGLMVASGVALLYSVNLISSPRYVAGTVLLAMAAALGAYSKPARIRVSALAFIASFVLLFPLASLTRRAETAQVEVNPLKSLTTGDFDAAVQISNSLRVIDVNGIEWGRQLLGVVLFWVPREYWLDKPKGTGVFIAEGMGYKFTNMSSPLPSEFLINGGWPLMILGMGFFGWAIRRVDRRIVAARLAGYHADTFAQIVPFYLVILLRGSLLSAGAQLLIIWVAARFIREPRKSPFPSSGLGLDHHAQSPAAHIVAQHG